MKKTLKTIYIFLIIVVIYMLQLFVINNHTLFGTKPNLILISVIVVSLWFGLYTGGIFSFLIGILTDILFGNTYGIFTIAYTITGMTIGFLNYNYRKENKLSLVYVTLIAVIIFEAIQYIAYTVVTGSYSSIFYLIKQMFMSSVLNIIIVYVIYELIYKIAKSVDDESNMYEIKRRY
ncbi:MAG: rod shape-determining protein MreD [Clostridia bacterium]|nr:rod shape-determining protein MreD [Clostridia bacterium]